MPKHAVAVKVDDATFCALDEYAVRHHWSKARAAEIILACYLRFEQDDLADSSPAVQEELPYPESESE
jgi:hypothetical protein